MVGKNNKWLTKWLTKTKKSRLQVESAEELIEPDFYRTDLPGFSERFHLLGRDMNIILKKYELTPKNTFFLKKLFIRKMISLKNRGASKTKRKKKRLEY